MRRILVGLKNILTIPLRIFSKISIFAIIQNSIIDRTSAISSGVKFYRSKIDKYSYIGRNSFVIDAQIGKFCSIGPGCNIGGTGHPTEWVSTSPVFHKWENIMKKNFSRHEYDIFSKTKIGNDVWIGTNVMIKAGIEISDGAVIGMGAIVTKDVGAYEVWAGNPAKLIKKRFKDEDIERLLEIKWWDMSEDKLEVKAKKFNNPENFINKFYEEE